MQSTGSPPWECTLLLIFPFPSPERYSRASSTCACLRAPFFLSYGALLVVTLSRCLPLVEADDEGRDSSMSGSSMSAVVWLGVVVVVVFFWSRGSSSWSLKRVRRTSQDGSEAVCVSEQFAHFAFVCGQILPALGWAQAVQVCSVVLCACAQMRQQSGRVHRRQ